MRYLFLVAIGCITIWLLQKAGILAALLLFLLAGYIPGTSLSIPPFIMLGLLALVLLIVVRGIKHQELIKQFRELKATADAHHRPAAAKATSQPIRRRFTQLQAQQQ